MSLSCQGTKVKKFKILVLVQNFSRIFRISKRVLDMVLVQVHLASAPPSSIVLLLNNLFKKLNTIVACTRSSFCEIFYINQAGLENSTSELHTRTVLNTGIIYSNIISGYEVIHACAHTILR